MRAAFKAVMDGKQVAFLAPTTVLAFQHQKTLTRAVRRVPRPDRDGQPLPDARPSRSRSLDDLAAGKVDIIVGTHRLLSKDVQFRDLGLLVVDEEQRFGVAHKETHQADAQASGRADDDATPIPRTLNMSLVGIRDMSIIETPPKDRLSIQTNVVKFDPQVIAAGDSHRAGARRPGLLRPQPRRVDLLDRQPRCSGSCPKRASSSATARWARTSSSARCSTSSRTSTTCCSRRRSSRTASTSRTRTRSSSTAPIATGCRSSISCAAASADRTAARTPTC